MQPPPIEAIGKFGSAPSINALFSAFATPSTPPPPPPQESEPPKASESTQSEGQLDVFA